MYELCPAQTVLPHPLSGVSQPQGQITVFVGFYILRKRAGVSHAHFSANKPSANPGKAQQERIGRKASCNCVDEEIEV